MKIILSGYFDCGYSIGIDDYPFNKPKALLEISKETGCQISFSKPAENYSFSHEELDETLFSSNDSEGHIGLSVPVGAGLCIQMLNTSLLASLMDEANEAACNKVFMGQYYENPPEDIVEVVKDFTQNVSFYKATVNLYGLGIGYIYLESNELPERLTSRALWIYRCYEYAAYGTYSSKVFRRSFKSLVNTVYSSLCDNSLVNSITQRKIPSDFFPGFQLIVICADGNDSTIAQSALHGYDEFQSIQMDDGLVRLGWAAAIVEPSNREYMSRILYLLKMAQVYYGIADGFERLFSHHISASVRNSLTHKGTQYDASSLNMLRTIAHTVAEFTRFGALTQNISDLKLLNTFDQMGGLTPKIEHMASACEIFTNIQNEVLEQKQAQRDKRLNIYAMALTALTVVSVTADMISINETLTQKGVVILIKLAAIQGFIILIIYMIFQGKYRRKKRDS